MEVYVQLRLVERTVLVPWVKAGNVYMKTHSHTQHERTHAHAHIIRLVCWVMHTYRRQHVGSRGKDSRKGAFDASS